MTKTEFVRSIEDLLELEPNSLTGDEALNEFEHWDSLAIINVIALADQECGVTPTASQVAVCRTLIDLAAVCGVDDCR